MTHAVTSNSYRFRAGQILGLNYTANASPSYVRGVVGVRYDDDLTEEFVLMATSLTTTRATFVIYPGTQQTLAPTQTFYKSGVVEYAQVVQGGATKIAQRGQLYCSLVIADLGSFESHTLCADYLFTGNSLTLGVVVPPGPAGGQGCLLNLTTADPAAGAEIADQVVPAGAIWLLRLFTVQIVQGITQTPLPALEFETTGGVQAALIPAMTTALGASTTAQLTWGIGLVQESFVAVVGDEMYTAPLPLFYFSAASPQPGITSVIDRFATFTDGIGANTNYGPALYQVEEWVMPN